MSSGETTVTVTGKGRGGRIRRSWPAPSTRSARRPPDVPHERGEDGTTVRPMPGRVRRATAGRGRGGPVRVHRRVPDRQQRLRTASPSRHPDTHGANRARLSATCRSRWSTDGMKDSSFRNAGLFTEMQDFSPNGRLFISPNRPSLSCPTAPVSRDRPRRAGPLPVAPWRRPAIRPRPGRVDGGLHRQCFLQQGLRLVHLARFGGRTKSRALAARNASSKRMASSTCGGALP